MFKKIEDPTYLVMDEIAIFYTFAKFLQFQFKECPENYTLYARECERLK
jgi:hypothetical protein